jgi:hypothetical protein
MFILTSLTLPLAARTADDRRELAAGAAPWRPESISTGWRFDR